MPNTRIEHDAVLVITDAEFGVLFSQDNVKVSERAIVLTVRDDATMAERIEMGARAVEIIRARKGSS